MAFSALPSATARVKIVLWPVSERRMRATCLAFTASEIESLRAAVKHRRDHPGQARAACGVLAARLANFSFDCKCFHVPFLLPLKLRIRYSEAASRPEESLFVLRRDSLNKQLADRRLFVNRLNAARQQRRHAQHLDLRHGFCAASFSGTESVTTTSSIADFVIRSTAGPESTAMRASREHSRRAVSRAAPRRSSPAFRRCR